MKSSISSSNSSLGFVNLIMEFNFIIFILQINLGLYSKSCFFVLIHFSWCTHFRETILLLINIHLWPMNSVCLLLQILWVFLNLLWILICILRFVLRLNLLLTSAILCEWISIISNFDSLILIYDSYYFLCLFQNLCIFLRTLPIKFRWSI